MLPVGEVVVFREESRLAVLSAIAALILTRYDGACHIKGAPSWRAADMEHRKCGS